MKRIILLVAAAHILVTTLLIGQVPTSHADQNATALPTNTRRPTATEMPITPTRTPVSTFISTLAPAPFGGSDFATWTLPPSVFKFSEHFVMGRPIGSDGVNYLARNYAFGSTDGGGRPIHHGVDFENPTGTPVYAAAEGVVEYAGDDVRKLFGPQPNFYGNVVVIRHKFVDYSGQPVFSLYGHLSRINVTTGQKVKQGDFIALVGSAGVAVGSHLHFEVRVGDPTDYNAVRNPELWIQPFTTFGAVAGRVLSTTGEKLYSVRVEIQAAVYRETTTYADDTVSSDTQLGENFVVSDLPGGYYTIFVKSDNGALRYRNTIYVRANKVTWIEIYIAP